MNNKPTYQDENGLTYTELIRQEYGGNNCIISAGFVEGESKPDVDEIYLRLEKDNVEPTVLLLRPDEAQVIAWVLSGSVWSYLMSIKKPDATKNGG
jgi:hypothetical protein